MASTTIKVPTELRDRLAEYARRDHTTMAGVIAEALDVADERAFWAAVRTAHEAMSDEERTEYVADRTLRDDLADEADERVSAEGTW